MGRETRHLGDNPLESQQTFFGQTRSSIEVQLSEIGVAFSGLSGYGRIALHDSAGYAAMMP